MTECCRNREVPETGTLRGVGGETFLPYPIAQTAAVGGQLAEFFLKRVGDTPVRSWKNFEK